MSAESKKDGTATGTAHADRSDRSARTRAIGALLPGIAGETLGRRGFAEGTLFRQWREIVGADIAADCVPEKLGYPTGRRSEGTLQVVASGGAALELQHRASQIIERVNGYLGYGAIAHLRIRQGRLPQRRRAVPIDDEPTENRHGTTFDLPALDAIADPKLKEALADFGHSIRRGERRRKAALKPR